MSIEKNTNEKMINEYLERGGDLAAFMHASDPRALAKEKGYKAYLLSDNEYVLAKEGATLDIVERVFYNGERYLLMEPVNHRPEWTEETEALALGGCQFNRFAAKMWQSMYREPNAKTSICTRFMPVIVASMLLEHYGVEQELAFEMARKLLLFGTEHFGKKEVAGLNDFLFPWEWATRSYICYAPGEIEAITDVCHEIIQTTGTVENLSMYDMAQFKKRLQEKASSIPPTIDIALYGRHINGAGLKEYQSSVNFISVSRV